MELNQHLDGLALGGIRRFTALAQERGDCILLTLGEPEFDTPAPIRRACREALDRGLTHYTETGAACPCAGPSLNLNAGPGTWTMSRRRFSSPWAPPRPFTPPSPAS